MYERMFMFISYRFIKAHKYSNVLSMVHQDLIRLITFKAINMISTKCSELVRDIRITMCMTQKEFSEEVGISSITISRYEQGKRHPSFKILRSIIEIANKNGFSITATDFDLPRPGRNAS